MASRLDIVIPVYNEVARLPTRDATNGFRLFSRRVIEDIEIESDIGF